MANARTLNFNTVMTSKLEGRPTVRFEKRGDAFLFRPTNRSTGPTTAVMATVTSKGNNATASLGVARMKQLDVTLEPGKYAVVERTYKWFELVPATVTNSDLPLVTVSAK